MPPKVRIEALTPKGTVLGDEAFERQSGLDEVPSMGPFDGISAFIRDTRELVCSCPHPQPCSLPFPYMMPFKLITKLYAFIKCL